MGTRICQTSFGTNVVNATNALLRIVRSVGSIFAGVLATVVLSLGTDFLMHATRIYPPWGEPMQDSQFAVAAIYRSLFAIAGSYLTAWLAPVRPLQHALALGVVGAILALIGAIATWNGGPEVGRKWYPISLIVISIPCSWVGGKLRLRQLKGVDSETTRQEQSGDS